MIQRLEVKGLNNRVDANLVFNEDLNIITGKNGSGKTTLLKLIWYLISGNLERILPEILFQFVSIETDQFSLSIKPDKHEFNYNSAEGDMCVDFNIPLETIDLERIDELNKIIVSKMKSSLFFPTFRRIEGGFTRSSRYITANIPREYGGWMFRDMATDRLQEALSQLSKAVSVYNHKFIASISTHDIVDLLTEKYADVSEEISELQSRLLNDISKRIQDSSSGGKALETQIPQDEVSVLNDIKQVTEMRDSLLRPFSVLSELTRNILQYQAIRVTGQLVHGEGTDGITLGEGTDGITLGKAKKAISSDILSAGEKQMLSFLCYNAFSEKTAIFIDEPELSLHVDWQRLLLPTLLEQKTENQFFIATHSPFIYSKYPDKEILLGDDRGAS